MSAAEYQKATPRELSMLWDAQQTRFYLNDYLSARISATVAQVHARKGVRIKPAAFMYTTRAQATRADSRELMTGDQVLAAFQAMGVPIRDKRNAPAPAAAPDRKDG